jgi:hypothetical protein
MTPFPLTLSEKVVPTVEREYICTDELESMFTICG